MAAVSSGAPFSEANLLALTGEEALEDIRELTLRNHKLQSFDQGETARLINLQVMSLSHNLLSSLAGFQHLKHLVSLNLNFNALTSLEGISSCTALQHLFVANNRVRDVSPLVPCTNLTTLHLFRNNIANLDMTMVVLAALPKLRELELAGNPCSLAPDYKHRVVLQLELQSIDGDGITQLDYDLANEYFASHGGMPPELGPRVDILTLEEVDGASGSAAAAACQTAASDGPPEHGTVGTATDGMAASATTGASSAAARSSGGSSPAAMQGADANGRPSTAAWPPGPRMGRAAGCSAPVGTGPGTAATAGVPLQPQPLLPRPGTAARRPDTATAGTSGRPGSAYSGLQSSVQLLSNEILNDHPLIIEYLAKHVLMEGLALAEQHSGAQGRPGSSGSGSGGGTGRGPSFAQRLRDTTAAMNACEDVDPKKLAEQQQELIATSLTVRRGMAEEMVASASPNELCRQLVRLCEVLIKEVEACRTGRPASSGPGTVARPGTAAGLRPMTAGLHSSSSAPSSSVLTPPEIGELIQLRADVERLCRENKALRLENENMYWLVEEVKRLKAERAGSSGR
ncbi:hypothetical protein Vretimale_8805 [Volvox reticuliferus]|uniref:Uncharacterized protein n=1 Tax=Volvox reticuliferus TaxID=1737510 RepID=A0A8J4LPA4_9CHLO|nr:hypothetical protein Vretifemale_6315 [Volvox reticuliferus]GIM04186.1 hypothetical protein Vretimale_8805 [Volvox reticuliferus]